MYGWVGLGDLDPGPARDVGVGARVVNLQLVHGLEVEGDAPVAAVDLEPDRVLAAGGEPGRLEDAQGAAVQPCREDGGVVHRDVAHALPRRWRPGHRTSTTAGDAA